MDTKQVLQAIQDENISFIDFWFVDIFGELHNVGMPSYAIDENSFVNGLEKLDASSIVGFKSVNNEKVIVLRFIQGRNPDWVDIPFFAKYDENAIWLDDLEPISDEKFFFEEGMMEFQKTKLN